MTLRWLAGLAVCGLVTFALAAGHAADVLKSIVDTQRTLISQAQEKAKADGSKIDIADIQRQVKAKAEEAIKDVDPAKVDASEAMDWAQIFRYAGRTKDTQSLLTTFLGTHPDGMKLYQAQTMMLGAASQNHDNKTLADTLQGMKPYDTASSIGFASIAMSYVPMVVDQLGVDKSVALIDSAMGNIKEADLTDQLKQRYSTLQVSAITTKADIYKDAGQKDKALKVLDDGMASVPPALKNRLATTRNQLTLVGGVAPTLKIERGYGDFKGLDGLKGKVVVLDFFAHWCPPCKAEFPDMAKMVSDLKPQGLEVVGVTTYYGYIGDPQTKLSPDDEYKKMADFIKDQKITWPVVFGSRENFEAYGVTAIPHVVVIGRNGAVHSLDIGYSPELFAKFRKNLEALLAEK